MLPYTYYLFITQFEKIGGGDFHKAVSSDCEFRQNRLRTDRTFRMGVNDMTSHM
jgi:hypothetical protein